VRHFVVPLLALPVLALPVFAQVGVHNPLSPSGPQALPPFPPSAPTVPGAYTPNPSPIPSGFSIQPQAANGAFPSGQSPSSPTVPPAAAAQIAVSNANAQQLSLQNAAILSTQLSQMPPSATPEDVARATAAYFTNGAEATTVPTSGPAAAYFNNAASVLTVPTSVVPFAAPTATEVPSAPAVPPEAAPVPPPAVYVFVTPAASQAPAAEAPATESAPPAPPPPTTAAPEATEAAPPPVLAAIPSRPEVSTRPSFPKTLPELSLPPTSPIEAAPAPESRLPSSTGVMVALVLAGMGLGAGLMLLGSRLHRWA
jgi:hypothetical protein